MILKVKRLHEDAILPTYAHGKWEDAGLDLYALENFTIFNTGLIVIRTGIAIELPIGFYAAIVPRSGLAFNYGISIVNSPGTIDPSYRGEIKIGLYAIHEWGISCINFKKGERIAQMIIKRYEPCDIEEIEMLGRTERGEAGFGSTGK